jgi:hypothetical protein
MSAPYALHFSGDVCNALIGSNEMSASTGGDFVAVMVDGVPLVGSRLEDGHYLLNVLLFDATNEDDVVSNFGTSMNGGRGAEDQVAAARPPYQECPPQPCKPRPRTVTAG